MKVDRETVERAHASSSNGRLRLILVAELASGLSLSRSATDEFRALPINTLLALVMGLHASERVFRIHEKAAQRGGLTEAVPTICEATALVRAFTQIQDVEVRATVVELLSSFAALDAAFKEAAQRTRLNKLGH